MAEGDVYQTQVWFDFQGDDTSFNTFYMEVNTDPSGISIEEDLNNYFNTVVLLALNSQLQSNFSYTCIDSKRIWDGTANELVTSIGRQLTTGVPGLDTAAAIPGQCSLVIQTLGDFEEANPSRRGRDFYTGFPIDQTDNGEWVESAAQSWMESLRDNLIPAATNDGGNYSWVNFSFKLARQAEQPANPQTVIGVLRALKQVRTQRRRQPLNVCDRYINESTL